MMNKKSLHVKQSTDTQSKRCSISKAVAAMKEPVRAVLSGVDHDVAIQSVFSICPMNQ